MLKSSGEEEEDNSQTEPEEEEEGGTTISQKRKRGSAFDLEEDKPKKRRGESQIYFEGKEELEEEEEPTVILKLGAWQAPRKPKQDHLKQVPKPKIKPVVRQNMLNGKGKKPGRKSHHKKPKNTSVYVTDTAKVHAYLKINGKCVFWSENGKACQAIEFYDMGVTNQKGMKDNPHAEDWIFAAFHARLNGTKNLDEAIEQRFSSKKNNTRRTNQHVFSLVINFSPCLGCVESIKGFHEFLKTNFGKDNFLLRVKFLRPYLLNNQIKNPETVQAKNFEASVKRLNEAGIPVRIQPLRSAKKLYSGINEKKLNRAHMRFLFRSESMQWPYKTWLALEANRKLPANIAA